MKLTNNKGITLIALVITIIILLILAGITIATLTGENGILTKADTAKEQTKISEYYEKIEMVRTELRLENENFTNPTLIQLQEEFKNNQTKWVATANIEQVEGMEKLVLTTKEGYIYYITETKTEYKGKGKVVDTAALNNKEALKLEIVGDATNGKLVKITDLSGVDYYNIEYQINSQDGEWLPIQSGETVAVQHSATIHARLTYGTNKGTIVSLSIESSNPTVTAKSTDTNNVVRKTNTAFADLFDITWGSDGTGNIEYTTSGNLNFNNTNYTSTEIDNLSELEIGNYTVTCKITSPSDKTATANKTVKVTKLAPTSVTDASNSNVSANAIYSRYDLHYFRDLVNDGQFTINAKQMEDIDLNPGKWTTTSDEINQEINQITSFSSDAVQWQPIGSVNFDPNTKQKTYIKTFYGIYDGNEKKINGIYISNNSLSHMGLFSANRGIIKNVILKNSSITNTYGAGGIISSNEGKVINCINYANIISSRVVGGICGEGTGGVVSCVNYGKIEESTYNICNDSCVGGIMGYTNGNIENCKNYGSVSSKYVYSDPSYISAGGIIGRCDDNDNIVSNCSNSGKIFSETGGAGGIVGLSQKCVTTIQTSYNIGEILNNNYCAGGIAGLGININIENCYNKGKIRGTKAAAGITAYLVYGSIKSCYESGNDASSNRGTYSFVDNYTGFELSNNYIIGNLSNAVGNNVSLTSAQVQTKSAEDFKKPLTDTTSVAYLLNGGKSSEYWSQGKINNELINNGYPYLLENY